MHSEGTGPGGGVVATPTSVGVVYSSLLTGSLRVLVPSLKHQLLRPAWGEGGGGVGGQGLNPTSLIKRRIIITVKPPLKDTLNKGHLPSKG